MDKFDLPPNSVLGSPESVKNSTNLSPENSLDSLEGVAMKKESPEERAEALKRIRAKIDKDDPIDFSKAAAKDRFGESMRGFARRMEAVSVEDRLPVFYATLNSLVDMEKKVTTDSDKEWWERDVIAFLVKDGYSPERIRQEVEKSGLNEGQLRQLYDVYEARLYDRYQQERNSPFNRIREWWRTRTWW